MSAAAAWIAFATLLNAAGFLWHLHRSGAAHRAELAALEAHRLLTAIAAMSAANQHRGTWHAWAQTMGTIRVRVETTPLWPAISRDA